jgi:gluconate 5-dehydrogenase
MDFVTELFSLPGKVAVVTGGSSGIGEAMAAALARAGARVVLVARQENKLAAAAAAIQHSGGKAAWIQADLAERPSLSSATTAISDVFGEPDILVNCAGLNLRPPLAELAEDAWDQSMAVNVTAPFLLGQRFGPGMAERGWGRIINITSQQARRAFGNSGAYGVSKGAVESLTRSQSEAWAPRGVRVNAICPGWVSTPLTAEVAADPVRTAALAARTMIKRNGVPADFAGVAVFLASDASEFITGQTIHVDGGFSVT